PPPPQNGSRTRAAAPSRRVLSRERTSGASIDSTDDAPAGHVQSQPDAVALANVPVLLQVLRVRDAHRAPVRARAGARDPRWRGAQAREGAARADGRAPGGQRARGRAPAQLRPRRLHLVRLLDVRARARAGAAAAHEPRRARALGPRASARGDGIAGADARVDIRAADGDGA